MILVIVFYSSDDEQTSTSQPTVSLNEITYPSNIKCECGKRVRPTPETIDSSTWDLKCPCGKVAYRHPKREERKEQLDALLDMCD